MTTNQRADAIIQDILVNHLPRIREGLEKGYVDENQVLIVYDHLVRARILKELGAPAPPAHEDNLARINRELEQQEAIQGETRGDIPPMINVPVPGIPCGVLKQPESKVYSFTFDKEPHTFNHYRIKGAALRLLLPEAKKGYAIFQEAEGNAPDIQIKDDEQVELVGQTFYSVPPATFGTADMKKLDEIVATQPVPGRLLRELREGMAIIIGQSTVTHGYVYVTDIDATTGLPVNAQEKGRSKLFPVVMAKELAKDWTRRYADMEYRAEKVAETDWEKHVEKHACVCGGVIEDMPTSVETMLKCKQCGRTFLDEFELAEARKTETKVGQKCADATYWSTGTLINGTTPTPMETEINLNGRKTTIKAVNGKFTLTYEQIVRMAVNQRRGPLNAFTGSDEELPHETVVYHHRVPFDKLTGERDGSLWKGKSVECTPGMVIDCCNTGNA